MNFKMKALVAAAAVAMAGVAHADIQNPLGSGPFVGNSELVFSAWSDSAEVGFTWDVEHSGFLAGGVSDARLANLVDANAKTASTLTGPATIESKVGAVNGVVFDMKITGFDAFLSAAGNATDVKFNLFAGNATGLDYHLASFGSPLGALTGGNFDSVGTSFLNYVNAVNGKMAGTAATDDAVVTTSADGQAYAGSASWGNATLYPGLSFNAGLGEAIALTVLYGNNTVAAEAKAFTLNGGALQASTYLAQDGYHLQIAAVPAVPEPETYAMLLAGLGLVGAIARRRSI